MNEGIGDTMKTLKLRNQFQSDSTLIENEFIDYHMVDANGEFVKVYLFLLRHLHNPCMSLTISTIADCLQNTEKDILRALNYWQKDGLLTLEYDESGKISGITMGAAPVAEEPMEEEDTTPVAPAPATAMPKAESSASASEPTNIEPFRNRKELKSLLFIAEQYLGKTLSAKDIESIHYFYDGLHFSADLVEYLIEYCVENEHKNMHYIQKVALAWSESNITTVDQAKKNSSFYNKNCYSVLNAFGIKGRGPAAPELTYIKKWTGEYGFTLDIVLEACNRTMAKLHQPSFEYADSILKKWLTANVHHLSDLERLDLAHKQTVASRKTESRSAGKNKFNNFEGRTYDYDSLEKQLLSQ